MKWLTHQLSYYILVIRYLYCALWHSDDWDVIAKFGKYRRRIHCKRCGKDWMLDLVHETVRPWNDAYEAEYVNVKP